MAGLRLRGRRPTRRDRWQLAGAAAVAALLTGALAIWNLATDRPPGEKEPAPDSRAAGPLANPASSAPGEPSLKVQERAVAPVEPVVPLQPAEIGPPYLILDGLTFSAGSSAFTLAGLEGPPAAAACRGDDGNRWACGLQARAALNNLIQKRVLTCVPARTTPRGVVEANCTAEGIDIAESLVADGWARPIGDAQSAYAPALARAEREKRGLWNGNWTYSAGP